jgi:microcystin-dependent protein
MTYADDYNLRTTSVKFNDVADALDGLITRNYAGLTTGTTTDYIATPTPAWTNYTTSGLIVIIPHVTNSGASTINISSLGTKDIKIANTAIGSGVLQQNVPTILAYTGTYFEVLLQSVAIPVGTIYTYAGSTAPTGYSFCDGSSQSTTGSFAALFGVIGYTYGGSGASFNLPDLRRRVPIGKGASDTLGTNDSVAYASRSANLSRTIPAHYHGLGTGATLATTTSGGHGHSTHSSAVVDISHTHAASSVTGSVGGADGTHSHTETRIRVNDDGVGATYLAFGENGIRGTGTIASTGSDHGHGFSLSAAGQTLSATSKNVTGTVGGSDGTHSHAMTGLIGLVTGGVDGNASMTSGAGQYLYINYIIKT